MNKKSMLDRDNVELYIMSEEEEAMLAEILLEGNDDINAEISKEEQEKLLTEMMVRDQELGLYDEEFSMKEWARPNDMELQEWQEQILKKEIGDD